MGSLGEEGAEDGEGYILEEDGEEDCCCDLVHQLVTCHCEYQFS